MTLIRTFVLVLAVLLPTSWRIVHAVGDDKERGDKSSETKKGTPAEDGHRKAKTSKKDGHDMGDMKKGGMDKR